MTQRRLELLYKSAQLPETTRLPRLAAAMIEVNQRFNNFLVIIFWCVTGSLML
jgi:hypothetical protein